MSRFLLRPARTPLSSALLVLLVLATGPLAGSPRPPLEEAETWLRQEQFPAALRSLQAARAGASEGPERDRLSLRVVEVLLALGKTARARLELGRLVEREDPPLEALVHLARLHLEHLEEEPGSFDQVERILRRALARAPHDPGARVQWGHLARARGRYREASRRYQEVLDSWAPGYPPAAFGLARCHLDLGRPREAWEVMSAARERFPRDPDTHWFAGHVRWRLGGEDWLDETLDAYQEAMARAPENSRYKGAVLMVHAYQQDLEAVEPLLSLLEVEAPHGAATWLGRGVVRELAGEIEAARNAYRLALAADARSLWPAYLLGGILTGEGNPRLTGSRHQAERYAPLAPEEGQALRRRVERRSPEFPLLGPPGRAETY